MKKYNKFEKFLVQRISTTLSLGLLLVSACTGLQSVRQWKQHLSGSQLVYYWSSRGGFGSTLTEINFCRNGRYNSYNDGSFYGSPSNSADFVFDGRESGRWNIQRQGNKIILIYASDIGKKRAVPVELEDNGRINIGGTFFAVKRKGARC